MTESLILKVAINVPLTRIFDYLPAEDCVVRPRPGCRVRVPFGRRNQIGLIIDTAATSDLPHAELRRAITVLDAEPLFDANDLWLVRFVSDYYQHPIGEVVAAALPALLRQGKPLLPLQAALSLTEEGAATDAGQVAKRAPRQAALLHALQENTAVPFGTLDQKLPGWRTQRKPLLDKGWVRLEQVVDIANDRPQLSEPRPGPTLNPEQREALAALTGQTGFRTTLLDGVTGSGKTEVYMRVMQEVLGAGRQVLILVPEIGLTSQFVARLKERIGITPMLLHSGLSDSERLLAWRSARSGSAPLILGTRSAVFVPLKSPGLIVVDEEHDASFKQTEGLRYSARDVAIVRGKHLDIPVILGSATPSLECLRRAEEGAYQHLTLTARAGGAVPPLMRLIDLHKHPLEDGLSAPLLTAIGDHIQRGHQALLFINRRGFAPTLICAECRRMAECSRCDSRMTVHRSSNKLSCHHCGASRPLDARCHECGGSCVPLGQGTERIEDALRARFPGQTITRIDSDSTRLKGTMDKAFAMAMSGEAKILVGTQMLSKGHHFPKLTLVGVINADQGLFSTDFRGSERLAQSLIQVAGRAGREKQQGEVFIQTAFADHPFWKELFAGGYHQVARFALAEREACAWPPYSRLALLRAASHKREHTWAFLHAAAASANATQLNGVRILGPVSAPMERKAGRYRGQLLLQSRDRRVLHQLLDILRRDLEGHVAGRRVRWSIDVDPIELF
ncbi:MAG: primosomal protein N' [Proteobacteria bacterium]|nr:primosomal protein N' [Pseudomonadota bacterium]